MSRWLDGFVDLPPVLTTVFKLTALLGAGWLIHFGLYRCNPRWRVLMWRGIFAGLVLLPLAGLVIPEMRVVVSDVPATHQAPPEHGERTSVPPPEFVTPDYLAPLKFLIPPEEMPVEAKAPLPDPPPIVAAKSASHAPKGETLPGWLAHHGMVLLLVGWGAGILVIGVRTLSTLRRVRRILGDSQPAPEQACDALAKVAEGLGWRGRVELRVGQDLSSPFLACPIHTGRLHSVIVVPRRMIDETYRDDLPVILVHELAHLNSHDSTWAAVGNGLAMLGWPHPLTWRMCAAHTMACEQVCDAVAAEHAGGTALYTRTLARAALEVAGVEQVAGGLPMLRSAKITRRLRHLKRGIRAAALPRPWVVSAVLLGAVVLAGLGGVKLVRAEHGPLGSKNLPGALNNIGPDAKEAVPALIEALKDEDKTARQNAAEALGNMGPDAKDAVPTLIETLKDKYGAVRRAAADALGSIGPDAEEAVPALIEALKNKDGTVHRAAASALGSIGPDAVPELIEALKNDDGTLRENAANASSFLYKTSN